MALWLSELLADPSLGAEVVAGHAGIDERGPIRWAHSSELPDPTPWLEGGELLLTTGLGIKDDAAVQRRFVEGLVARGVVALGFSTGVSLDRVPDELMAACEDLDLPLFIVPYEIPFIAVSRRVAHHVFEERYATLRQSVDLHRAVLANLVGDAGVPGVLATVAKAMPGIALVAFDFAGCELGRADPDGAATGLTDAAIWAALPPKRSRATTEHEGWALTSASVLHGEHLEAVLVAVSGAPLLEHETLLFEQGVAGLSLELARHRSVRDAHRARIDDLLEEIAAGRATTGLIERTIERVRTSPLPAYRVLAIGRPPEAASDHAVCTVVEDALVGFGPPLVGRLDGTLHALVPDDADGHDAAGLVERALEQRGWSKVAIGRSRHKTGVDELRAAIREAGVALHLDGPPTVRDVDEVGLPGLLAGIRDDRGAADFVTRVLGPVLDHDATGSAGLIATLRAYLAHGCRPGPAADELCIHRHTLAYRLDRVRDLTGRDPRAGEHLLEFGLALELLDRDLP